MPSPETLDFGPESGPYSDQEIERIAKDTIKSRLQSDPHFMGMKPEEQNTAIDKLFYGNFAHYLEQAREHWRATHGQIEQTESRKEAA